MSSSCLSGAGGRTYGFDFEFVKSSTSSSTRTTSHTSSSPSSTISESSNSPLSLYTRKPRTPRKRPNQTYNEATALLSTAYPNLFPTKTPPNSHPNTAPFLDESSELLLPFRVFDGSSFLLQHHHYRGEPPPFAAEPKVVSVHQDKPCQSPGEISSRVNSLQLEEERPCGEDDFDAESMLDEEIEEGIDSIMGSGVELENSASSEENPWIGFGGKLDFRLGLRRQGVRAFRHVDDCNWWNLPAVDILQISPKIGNKPAPVASAPPPAAAAAEKEKEKKQKKKKKVEKHSVEAKSAELLPNKGNNDSPAVPKPNSGLMLKLNYDGVRSAWSDRGSPFADDGSASDSPGNDVTGRLSQIDLLWENGGVREASVLRYKEKRRTRLFSKKIRYQVRKVNADRRPRMQGRFVRRPNCR